MPTQTIDFAGLDRIQARLSRLGSLSTADVAPLGQRLERIMHEDNRKGVLEGTNKDGQPLKSVTYRPKPEGRTAFPGHNGGAQPTKARSGGAFGLPSGAFKGPKSATHAGTARNGNLTSAQYRRLDGPPLAPRYDKSRVITNYTTVSDAPPGGWDGHTLTVVGFWAEVVDVQGRPFLPRAFRVRDLRGVRPWGMAEARKAVREWASWLLRRA